jgi:(p)ppGpp synthase/HD superfamily hydrolase
MSTTEEKIVALLHDIVEDTEITFEYLEHEGFSKEVVAAVKAITRELEEPYNAYLRRVAQNELAYKVKLADMLDNSDVTRFGANPTEEQATKCASYVKKRNTLVTLRANLAST